MPPLDNILQQLRQERVSVQRQLNSLDQAIAALQGGGRRRGRPAGTTTQTGRWRGPRRMSAAAREKIAAAQRARWAKVKREKKK